MKWGISSFWLFGWDGRKCTEMGVIRVFLLVQGLGFLGFGVLGFGPETTLEQGGVCWYGWQEEEGHVL